jgi:prepilin-type N-terminal cleavage/methylation domain-containing protein/prepilin-type processing-associated H-X9-DG protein
MTRRSRSGFTLMELLIVIAIIGVLAAILLPGLARSRESARRASCAAGLSQIGMGLHMYADEHDRQFPWSGGGNNADSLIYFFPRYGLSENNFICPSDGDNGLRELDGNKPYRGLDTRLEHSLSLRASYDYFGAYTNAPLTLPPVQAVGFPRVPIMWDKGAEARAGDNHIWGSNVLWMDGSVEFMLKGEFASKNLPYAPKGLAYLVPESAPGEKSVDEELSQRNRNRNKFLSIDEPMNQWSTAIPVPPPVQEFTPEEKAIWRRR